MNKCGTSQYLCMYMYRIKGVHVGPCSIYEWWLDMLKVVLTQYRNVSTI